MITKACITNAWTLSDFAHHFIMVFELSSTKDATHLFIHPELTNSSILVELKFDTDMTKH